jgi:GNAT superfamily N-acetyltransferase
VNINRMNYGIGEFAMLAVERNRRGKGIGSALVDHAETWARNRARHTIQFERLTPRHWTRPSREFLKQ